MCCRAAEQQERNSLLRPTLNMFRGTCYILKYYSNLFRVPLVPITKDTLPSLYCSDIFTLVLPKQECSAMWDVAMPDVKPPSAQTRLRIMAMHMQCPFAVSAHSS